MKIKIHNVKSHQIVQFDKFNGHTSVAISCASSPRSFAHYSDAKVTRVQPNSTGFSFVTQ